MKGNGWDAKGRRPPDPRRGISPWTKEKEKKDCRTRMAVSHDPQSEVQRSSPFDPEWHGDLLTAPRSSPPFFVKCDEIQPPEPKKAPKEIVVEMITYK